MQNRNSIWERIKLNLTLGAIFIIIGLIVAYFTSCKKDEELGEYWPHYSVMTKITSDADSLSFVRWNERDSSLLKLYQEGGKGYSVRRDTVTHLWETSFFMPTDEYWQFFYSSGTTVKVEFYRDSVLYETYTADLTKGESGTTYTFYLKSD